MNIEIKKFTINTVLTKKCTTRNKMILTKLNTLIKQTFTSKSLDEKIFSLFKAQFALSVDTINPTCTHS